MANGITSYNQERTWESNIDQAPNLFQDDTRPSRYTISQNSVGEHSHSGIFNFVYNFLNLQRHRQKILFGNNIGKVSFRVIREVRGYPRMLVNSPEIVKLSVFVK